MKNFVCCLMKNKNLLLINMYQSILVSVLLFCGACSEHGDKVEMKISNYALIDLHLHLDGSLSPEALCEMAQIGRAHV